MALPSAGTPVAHEERVALVTGGNAGIGLATCAALARDDYTVYMAARREDSARAEIAKLQADTGNDNIFFLNLDLSSLASVRAAADEFLGYKKPLHALINNAGLLPPEKGASTVDGFEQAFGVNHLGHFLFTLLLLDRMKDSAPARIVNVSSSAHYQTDSMDWDSFTKPTASDNDWVAYRRSKACNVIFTLELARRLAGTGVTANAVHPGVVNSGFFAASGCMQYLVCCCCKSVSSGAATQVYLARSPDVEGVTGQYFHAARKSRPPSGLCQNDAVARELWERSAVWSNAGRLADVDHSGGASGAGALAGAGSATPSDVGAAALAGAAAGEAEEKPATQDPPSGASEARESKED